MPTVEQEDPSSSSSSSNMLNLFEEYKQFYSKQISNRNIDNNVKIRLMEKVIAELFEQNELLLRMLLEVEQSAIDRSSQMHSLLSKTAKLGTNLGLALTDYEINVKRFTQNSLPIFIECAEFVTQIGSRVDFLEKENHDLHRTNECFFRDLKAQDAELMQFKRMTSRLASCERKTIGSDRMALSFSRSSSNERFDAPRRDYLELVVENKLSEISQDLDQLICADVLQAMLCSVQTAIEIENNCPQSNSISLEAETEMARNEVGNGANISIINNNNNNNCKISSKLWCDINDNYESNDEEEEEEEEEEDENEENDNFNQDYHISACDTNLCQIENRENESQNYRSIISLLSTAIDELHAKTFVIFDLRRRLAQRKRRHLSLQNFCLQSQIRTLNDIVWMREQIASTKCIMRDASQQISDQGSLLNRIDSLIVRLSRSSSSSSSSS